MGSQPADEIPATRWCAVTGGRGFMARHLVAALLRSGEWRVRVTNLAPDVVLGRGETEELLANGLHDGPFEGVDVVFHTAAGDSGKNDMQFHYKVNVNGQR
ncbi:hypothetical protein EJB05_06167, partial [Eragrostis curvula]